METSKDLIGRLYQMSRDAGDCLYLLQTAFIYNSSKALDDCEAKAGEIRGQEEAVTRDLIEAVKADTGARVYLPVPGHIGRIAAHILDIAAGFRTRIGEGILFTDKAVSEVIFLLERLQDVLKNTGDIILVRNRIVRQYIGEAAADIGRSARDFATMHEERLVEGLCTPQASPLFLAILDSLKGIAWHAKEIAEKLTP